MAVKRDSTLGRLLGYGANETHLTTVSQVREISPKKMSRFPARCCFTSMKPFYFSKRKLQLVPAAIILIALAISTSIFAQTITTFDAPGAGTGPFQGTYATEHQRLWDNHRIQP